MTLRSILLGFGAVSTLVFVASYIMIMADLHRRGIKTNILLSRIFFGRYLRAYRDATVKETGKPGPLYGVCLTAALITLVLVVGAILAAGR